MEKPGIEPAPGLQGIGLSPIPKTDKIQVKYIQVWKSPQKVFSLKKQKTTTTLFVAFP